MYTVLFDILVYYGLSQDVAYSSRVPFSPEFPVLYRRTLLSIHSVCNSLHLTNPKLSTHLSPSPLPPGNHKSAIYISESVSLLEIGSFVS